MFPVLALTLVLVHQLVGPFSVVTKPTVNIVARFACDLLLSAVLCRTNANVVLGHGKHWVSLLLHECVPRPCGQIAIEHLQAEARSRKTWQQLLTVRLHCYKSIIVVLTVAIGLQLSSWRPYILCHRSLISIAKWRPRTRGGTAVFLVVHESQLALEKS